MTRITLDDGGWFDNSSCDEWDELATWDKRHACWIPVATKSVTGRETLYRTASGRWILRSWSTVRDTMSTYYRISATEAISWLKRNGHGVSAQGGF